MRLTLACSSQARQLDEVPAQDEKKIETGRYRQVVIPRQAVLPAKRERDSQPERYTLATLAEGLQPLCVQSLNPYIRWCLLPDEMS